MVTPSGQTRKQTQTQAQPQKKQNTAPAQVQDRRSQGTVSNNSRSHSAEISRKNSNVGRQNIPAQRNVDRKPNHKPAAVQYHNNLPPKRGPEYVRPYLEPKHRPMPSYRYGDHYFGHRITILPRGYVVMRVGGLDYYYYNGVEMIDASGNVLAAAQAITIPNNVSFDAAWFGGAVDYFGLASSALVPFESNDGTTRPRVVTRHYGKGQGGDETGPVWMNPTTKYMVVANTTFATTLGKAFAAKYSGGTMTKTGYMISSVTIETSIGQFPVVTVSAEEGPAAARRAAMEAKCL